LKAITEAHKDFKNRIVTEKLMPYYKLYRRASIFRKTARIMGSVETKKKPIKQVAELLEEMQSAGMVDTLSFKEVERIYLQ